MHGGLQRLLSKLAHGSKQQGGWGDHLQTQCSHGWLQKRNSYAVTSKLAQAGGWWGAAPPCLQTYCSHCERGGGGVSKDSYCAWRVSITTRRLSSKLAHDLKQRGVGGQPPPICKHQCSHGWFQKHSLAQRAQQSPAICKHTAHLVNGGVSKKTQIRSRQHYLTSTVLTVVIVILIFTYIFIAIISMCMQACMNACMYMQWM